MNKNWFGRNFKWAVPTFFLLVLILYLVFSSGLEKVSSDLVQAYADEPLYEDAISLANKNKEIQENLGYIQPMDKMSILNGEVNYSKDHQKVSTTIKIKGDKSNGKLDIEAHRNSNEWIYDKINIRIKDSSNKTQTIGVITSIK